MNQAMRKLKGSFATGAVIGGMGILGLLAAAVLIVMGILIGVAFLGLKAMIPAALCWFVWTYLELGLTYFPGAQPVPFWHFLLSWMLIVWVLRQMFRPANVSAGKNHSR